MGLRIINKSSHHISAKDYEQQQQAMLKMAAEFWSNSKGVSTTSDESGFIERITAARSCINNGDAANSKAEDVKCKIIDHSSQSLKLQAHLDFATLVKLLQ